MSQRELIELKKKEMHHEKARVRLVLILRELAHLRRKRKGSLQWENELRKEDEKRKGRRG